MTEVFFISAAIICTAYILLQIQLMLWWRKKIAVSIPAEFSRKMIVIVPARNESENIRNCIRSLKKQNYPAHLLKIFIVNDHSDDDTFQLASNEIAADARFVLLSLPENLSGKKKAIAYAARQADIPGERILVVTTDADCVHHPDWLKMLAAADEKYQPAMISAPVKMSGENNFRDAFQQLEWCGLQLAGGAALQGGKAMMCSGANLAYPLSLLRSVDFFDHDKKVSGDDMLLLQIAARGKNPVLFLGSENTVVETRAASSWKMMLRQRIRWTSKAGRYRGFFLLFSSVLVLLMNFWLLVSLLFSAAGFLPWKAFIVPLISKAFIDFLFLTLATAVFRQRKSLLYFVPAQVLYFFFVVWAAIAGLAGTVEWKGRRYKRGTA